MVNCMGKMKCCLPLTLFMALTSTMLCQDYDDNSDMEIESEYEDYPQPLPDHDHYPQPRPNHDRYPTPLTDHDHYPVAQTDYDHYPQPQTDYDHYPQPHPDYDSYAQPDPDYTHLSELHPDYDRYEQLQPDYDIYAERQPDYGNYVQQLYPHRPLCPIECDCPINFPSAMYCEDRSLNFIPIIPPGIRYVYLQNNMIEDIRASVFYNATDLLWLILDHNHITNENIEKGSFEKLVNLEKLLFSYNNLTEPVGPLAKSVNELRLIGNKLSKLPSGTLSGLENLTALYLQGNELTTESIAGAFVGLTSLEYLDISSNKLNSLPSGIPSSVQTLYADQNNINSISAGYLQDLPSLQYLRMSHNQLADTGISIGTFNISTLIELDLSYNKLQFVPDINENLENLYLQANRINRIDTSSFCKYEGAFSGLTHLRLDGNNVTQKNLPMELPTCLRKITMVLID